MADQLTQLQNALDCYRKSLNELKMEQSQYARIKDYSQPLTLSLLKARDDFRALTAAIGDPEKSLQAQIRNVEAHILVISTMIDVCTNQREEALEKLTKILAVFKTL
jgi:hypothetical protein